MWDSVSFIFWFSDFATYLEDFLIYKHNTSGLYLGLISQYDLMFGFTLKVGHYDLYFMVK